MLRTSDDVSFFLNTKHILWLLEHHVISTAQFETSFLLDSKTMDDRNKSDIFVGIIAVGQALWFCVNIIGRGVQGLVVTTLEVTTAGIIVDSILVYYFWKDKPANVESTDVVKINMTLSEMTLLEEDEAARTRSCYRTPLDFANREIWNFGLLYHYFLNFYKGMRPRSWRWKKQKESLGRRSESDVLPVTGVTMVIGYLAGLAFLGTNFIAWNFHFPTSIERLLWRVSSCGLIGLAAVAVPAAEWNSNHRIMTMQENVRKHRKRLEDSGHPGETARRKDRLVHKFRILAMKIRNNSSANDPNLDVSVSFALTGMLILVVYFLFRAYLLMEDLVAFRALPAKAYSTVDWWRFVPHVG